MYKNDHFTKTGSGQTWGKHSTNRRCIFLGVEKADILRYLLLYHYGGVYADLGEKTPPFGRFYTKKEHFTKTGSGQT
eukprot:COSAG06_NODE_2468_length_6806_cov_3.728940_3_plen_77_part_00